MKQLLTLSSRQLKFAVIALPLVLTAFYLFFLAANRYVSESMVAVGQANQSGDVGVPGVAMLLGGLNPPSREDALYLQQFIHSLDLLKRLDAKVNLKEHYARYRMDFVFHLSPDASQEDFLDYYRNRVEVDLDDVASLLTIRVQGFEPEFAQRLNRAILDECEQFINAFSQRMARQQMAFAEGELASSSQHLQAAKGKLLAFQAKNKVLDPLGQMQANTSLTAQLQAAVSRQEAELHNALTYLNEDSYQIKAMRSQLDSTKRQLDIENKRSTVAPPGGRTINALGADFQDLMVQVTFAQDAYRVALTAVESARIEAARKVKSLIILEPPSQPETALYPRRLYDLVTLLVASLLAYGIARLVIASVREHLD